MAAQDLPYLIVGDVHGDLERLFEALKKYRADEWHTVFLGDLVDYGMFGVGALRYARDRPNSTVLLGNHEVAMLWALRERQRIGWWISIGGQPHDLDELARDPDLQGWLRARPAIVKLGDGTLAQHSGHDGYALWLHHGGNGAVDEVNGHVRELLTGGDERELWDVLSARNVFQHQPMRLQSWLQATNSRRVVFGHNPHRGAAPERYHGGAAINFDGGFSRGHRNHQRSSPLAATVAPLEVLS